MTHHTPVPRTASSIAPLLYGRRFDDGGAVTVTPIRPGAGDITAVVGRSGAGKSYWLMDHATQLIGQGARVIILDPLGDLRKIVEAHDGRTLTLGPGGSAHVNPFRQSADHVGVDLHSVFAVLLGDHFDASAEGLLARASAMLYITRGSDEPTFADVLETVASLAGDDGSDAVLTELTGATNTPGLAQLLEHATDVDFAVEPGHPVRIEFSDAVFDDDEGRVRALATLAAFGLVRAMSAADARPLVLIVNDLDFLLRPRSHLSALVEGFAVVLRAYRQRGQAVTFGLTADAEGHPKEAVQRAILAGADTFLLLRAPLPALDAIARIARVDPEVIRMVLTPDPGPAAARSESRPAVLVRNGRQKAIRIVGSRV